MTAWNDEEEEEKMGINILLRPVHCITVNQQSQRCGMTATEDEPRTEAWGGCNIEGWGGGRRSMAVDNVIDWVSNGYCGGETTWD